LFAVLHPRVSSFFDIQISTKSEAVEKAHGACFVCFFECEIHEVIARYEMAVECFAILELDELPSHRGLSFCQSWLDEEVVVLCRLTIGLPWAA
jgi:hypothetical protein